MGNIQTRSTLGDLGQRGLGPQFEDVFEQNLVKYSGRQYAEMIFDFQNTDNPTPRTTGLTGYALTSEFDEGTPYPSLVDYKTFETLYVIKDAGGSVEVTEDCLSDRERLGAKLDEMAKLAKSQDMEEVRAAFQILNGGFSSALTYNGVTISRYNSAALFQGSHSRADGGSSQSNYSAGSIALTETNLETGRLALVKQLTDVGLPIIDMGSLTLCVPDDLEKNATIYAGSELRPSTANNDINFYKGRINVLSSRWLNSANGGSSTAWFLLAKITGAPSALRVYRLGGPQYYERAADSKTGNLTFAVKNRRGVGYSFWQGQWASPGA